MTTCLTTNLLQAKFIHPYFIAAFKVSLWSASRLLEPWEKVGGDEGKQLITFFCHFRCLLIWLPGMFPALTHCKNGTANSALKSAETQEHLEVSSALKAACWFPQISQKVSKLYSWFENKKLRKLSMPDLLFGTSCQALASFMKCNSLSSAYEQTRIYSNLQQKTNSPFISSISRSPWKPICYKNFRDKRKYILILHSSFVFI